MEGSSSFRISQCLESLLAGSTDKPHEKPARGDILH